MQTVILLMMLFFALSPVAQVHMQDISNSNYINTINTITYANRRINAIEYKIWFDRYEGSIRTLVPAVIISRRFNTLVLQVVDHMFNKQRPEILTPSAVSVIGEIANIVSSNNNLAIVIVGYTEKANSIIDTRVASVASIFKISGIKETRLRAALLQQHKPEAGSVEIFFVPLEYLTDFDAFIGSNMPQLKTK